LDISIKNKFPKGRGVNLNIVPYDRVVKPNIERLKNHPIIV
jgi:hypothetical protein